MSAKNGDKSRFHRERKQKIERRQRNRKLLESLQDQQKTPKTAVAEPRERIA
jgi:hypothetical protein